MTKYIYELLVRGDENGLKGAHLVEMTSVPNFGVVLGEPQPLPESLDDPTWGTIISKLNTTAINQVSDLLARVSDLEDNNSSYQNQVSQLESELSSLNSEVVSLRSKLQNVNTTHLL